MQPSNFDSVNLLPVSTRLTGFRNALRVELWVLKRELAQLGLALYLPCIENRRVTRMRCLMGIMIG